MGNLLNNQAVVAVLSAAGGVLATLLASALLSRTARFRYSTRIDRIGTAADDPVFGAVRAQWRGNDVRNLHIVTLELENESPKDFENVRLKAYTPAETLILSERTSVVGSPNVVPSSPEFDARLAVPQGQAPTPAQWNEYNHHREYLLPVFNRGQVLEFRYVCTRPADDQPPFVFIDAPVKGVKLVHQFRTQLVLGVPLQKALGRGLVSALILSILSAVYLNSSWAVAAACLAAGLTAATIGALVYKGQRWLWNALFG